jgi:hypothetical protein
MTNVPGRLNARVFVMGVASLLVACGAQEPRTPETPCRDQLVGVALGFERAKVGANELPFGIFCGPKSDEPAPRVTFVEAHFAPTHALSGAEPVKSEIVYRPAARVLESSTDRLQFDYVVKVVFDRAGYWAMRLRIRAPWAANESDTTMMVLVEDDEPAGSETQ